MVRYGRIPVLIVDDEPSIHQLLGRLFGWHRIPTLHASSFATALDLASRHAISAMVLDLRLQAAESGLDLLRWLRASPAYRQLPVCIFTGSVTLNEDEEAAVTYHDAEVFFKGKDLNRLVERIAAATTHRAA